MKTIKNLAFMLISLIMFIAPNVVYADPLYECPYCKTTFDLAIEDTVMVYTDNENLIHIYNDESNYEGALTKAYVCPYCEAPLIVPENLNTQIENTTQTATISLKEEYATPGSQVTVVAKNVPEDWDRELYLTFYDLNTYQEYYLVLYRANNFIGRLPAPAGTYCIASAGALGDAAGRIQLSWAEDLDTFTLTNKQVVNIELNFSQETLDKYNGVYEEPEKGEEIVVEQPVEEEIIIEEPVQKTPLIIRILSAVVPYVVMFVVGLGIFVVVDKLKKNNKFE